MGSSETQQKSAEPVAVAMAYPSAPPPDVTAPPAPMNMGQPQMGVPVYPQQPPYQLQAATEYGPWSVGLCDCFSDCERFCISFWCPCVTFGQVAEILDRGSSSCGINGSIYVLIAWLTGCPCIYSCFYRSRMRHLYRLQGDCGEDFIVHFCCETCALTQMYRELQNRGFDVSLGWHGNVERQSRGVAMPPQMAPPVVEGGMSR